MFSLFFLKLLLLFTFHSARYYLIYARVRCTCSVMKQNESEGAIDFENIAKGMIFWFLILKLSEPPFYIEMGVSAK